MSRWAKSSWSIITTTIIIIVKYTCLYDYNTDINECASSPCHQNATCTNVDGSFTCECDVGYVGDGFICPGKIYQPMHMHN